MVKQAFWTNQVRLRHSNRESRLDLGAAARRDFPRAVAGSPGEQHRHLDAARGGPVAAGSSTARLAPGRAGPDGSYAAGRVARVCRRCPRRHVRSAPTPHRCPGVPGHRGAGAHPPDDPRPDAARPSAHAHVCAWRRVGLLNACLPGADPRSHPAL